MEEKQLGSSMGGQNREILDGVLTLRGELFVVHGCNKVLTYAEGSDKG